MAKNRVEVKGSNRRRIRQRDQDSDDSDEEYKVTDDEDFDESDESYSLGSDESEEISADFGKSRRVSRSRNTRRSKKVNESKKPQKRRRVSYTEDDNDDEEDADEDDEEFMPLDREANQVNKPVEKRRVLCTEVDDDDDGGDDDDDYKESAFSGRNIKQRKKPREKKRVVYTEEEEDNDDGDDDNDNDVEMSLDREDNKVSKPIEMKRISYTEVDDDDDGGDYDGGDDDDSGGDDDGGGDHNGGEDYKEFVFSGRNRKHTKKHREKKRVVYTDEDDDEEVEVADEDDAEFMSLGRKANRMKTPTKRKRVSYTDMDADDDDNEQGDDCAEFVSSSRKRSQRKKPQEKRDIYTEDDDEEEEEEEDFMYSGKKVNQKRNNREKREVLYTEADDDLGFMSTSRKRNQINKRREKRIVSYKEDNQEDEDESDAEFKLSDSDFVDDEDETQQMMTKKNMVIRSHPQKKSVRGRRKTSKKSKITTKPKQRNHKIGQKSVANKTQMENRNKISKRRKQRAIAESDSDFVSSASSDHEYTISEEEREQMREARVYCADLRAKLRSSSYGNQEKQPAAYEQKKYPIRKGKEKIEDVKDDLGKQVCGICLSEEQKRTMRGVLNCCRHYFCFACIMEWSKVESRCPLCKQRFTTITKAAKSDTGFESRTVVIPVPECDQVYEPSEEELRGYLDPYESVICTECHNGGDDALMLLCDICDSSAHTFCVGLGREVPEGNWYCEGCRPTVFGTLNSQHLTPSSDRRLNNNASDLSSSSPIAGGFDLNELYVPETPLTQQTRVPPEPNPAPTGTVATTLRDRRRMHRQIHHRFLNNNRMNDLVGRSSGTSASSSGIRLFGSQLDQARVSVSQNDHILSSMHDSSNFYPRTDQFSVRVHNSNLASDYVALQDEHGSNLGSAPILPCTNNRSSIREVIGSSRTWQGGLRAP